MKNELLTKGIILPSGEIGKDKINLVAGAITQPFAEMVWVTTGGDMETINRLTNVLVNGCCTTKRATPTTKSGDAGNGKYRFATLPCMRNGSFTPLTSIFKTKKLNRVIKWQEKR